MGSTILPILIGEIPYENQLRGYLQRLFAKQPNFESGLISSIISRFQALCASIKIYKNGLTALHIKF